MYHIFNQILISFVLLVAVVIPCSALEISEPDNGRHITISLGEEILIRLPGNPTTGYQWEVLPNDPTLLKQKGEPVFVSDTNLIGSGGQITFLFVPCGIGSTHLKLAYDRPWEKQKPPIRVFEIGITVK